MTYLYAGLGVALMIPLLSLVQILINVASFEGGSDSSRQEQFKLEADVVKDYKLKHMGSAFGNTDKCADKFSSSSNGWIWQGNYSKCDVFVAKALPNGGFKYLKMQLRHDDIETEIAKKVFIEDSCWVASPSSSEVCY